MLRYKGLNYFTAEDARSLSYRTDVERLIEETKQLAKLGMFDANFSGANNIDKDYLVAAGYEIITTLNNDNFTVSWSQSPEEVTNLAQQAIIDNILNPLLDKIKSIASNQGYYMSLSTDELQSLFQSQGMVYTYLGLVFIKDTLEDLGFDADIYYLGHIAITISWELD